MNLQSLSKMTEESRAELRQVWAFPQSSGHNHKEADETVHRELYFLLQSRSCPCLTTDSLPSTLPVFLDPPWSCLLFCFPGVQGSTCDFSVPRRYHWEATCPPGLSSCSCTSQTGASESELGYWGWGVGGITRSLRARKPSAGFLYLASSLTGAHWS